MNYYVPFSKGLTNNGANPLVIKLVYKVRSQRIYFGFKFPRKIRPFHGELLGSWLTCLSLLHRTVPVTFTNMFMPETRNKLWSADLDLQADSTVLDALYRSISVINTLDIFSIINDLRFLRFFSLMRVSKFASWSKRHLSKFRSCL